VLAETTLSYALCWLKKLMETARMLLVNTYFLALPILKLLFSHAVSFENKKIQHFQTSTGTHLFKKIIF